MLLLVAYGATLAPGVTLWDAGEFLAAIRTLGVPHPPGTPLFVVAARAWANLWSPLLPFATAVNLASAVATAAGCGLVATVVARAHGPLAVLVASVVGGVGFTVWSSATETEVYGWALLLMALMLWVADRAGTRWSSRHHALMCFLFGLAVPLHMSALVAGPAAVLLAATDLGGSVSWRRVSAGAGVWLLGVAVGTVSWAPALLGVLLFAASHGGGGEGPEVVRWGAMALLLGASFLGVMYVVATGDPVINQGDPSTWSRFQAVVARSQYDVPGLLPRRAPPWLQVGNILQYLDWQYARGWSDAVGASWRRTPLTLILVMFGLFGARSHREADPRTFRAVLLFVLCTSLGVVAVLNLRAGPSYGWGVVPDGALREARERDYFFAPFFVAWGAWVAVGLHRAMHRVPLAALGVVGLLAVSNVGATSRRDPARAPLARTLGLAMLDGSPPNSVLLLAGDNDAYATWYLQEVEGVRRDVVTVVVPLLPADWYRAQLRDRHQLFVAGDEQGWVSTADALRRIGLATTSLGRPLVVSTALGVSQREAISGGQGWRFRGHLFERSGSALSADSASVMRARALVLGVAASAQVPRGADPTEEYVWRLLRCPEVWISRQALGGEDESGLLESTCNYR
ncbi:MAG: DUF2723 domain-containing protein [Gemmatimonadetes bacterium]|nr:DUF2723 domain-containing protein [Gemmatimonadota bacterium]